jgi:hypothetical protein
VQLSRVNGSHAVVVLELPQADGEEISKHFSRKLKGQWLLSAHEKDTR